MSVRAHCDRVGCGVSAVPDHAETFWFTLKGHEARGQFCSLECLIAYVEQRKAAVEAREA